MLNVSFHPSKIGEQLDLLYIRKKIIFYLPVLNAERKRELFVCIVTQLLQITFFVRCLSFRSWSYIWFSLVLICLTFDLTLFKWWAFTQLNRAVLIRENGGVLTLLVSKTPEWCNIASTSQALRLANCNVSNRDSILINGTTLPPYSRRFDFVPHKRCEKCKKKNKTN